VSSDTNISIEFRGIVRIGSGYVTLSPSLQGNAIEIDLEDASQVSLSQDIDRTTQLPYSILVINPSRNLPEAAIPQRIRVTTSSGAILDGSGTQNFAIQGQDYEFELADTVGPVLVSRFPEVGAEDVPPATVLRLEFNEAIVLSTVGNITVSPESNPTAAVVHGPTDVLVQGRVVLVPGTGLSSNQTAETFSVTVSANLILDTAGNAFAGISDGYTFTVADFIAPALISVSPLNDTILANSTTTIVFIFNEEIATRSGNIVFLSSDITYTIAITDTTQVSVSGNVVRVQLSSGAFSGGTTGLTYHVQIASGVIVDSSTTANAFGGLNGSDYIFSVADTSPPFIVARVPEIGAVNVPLRPTVVVQFNEAVRAGSGNITFVPSNTGSPNVVSADNTQFVSFFPNGTMLVQSSETLTSAVEEQFYSIIIDSSAVVDVAGNSFEGVPGGVWLVEVVDATPPTLLSLRPQNRSESVSANSTFVLEFSEPMSLGSGSIVLVSLTNSSESVTISVDSTEVLIEDDVVLVTPAFALPSGQSGSQYAMQMGSGVLTDDARVVNPFGGLFGSDYVFSIQDSRAPSIQLFFPSRNATRVSANTSISLTFNEVVRAGQGTITITPMDVGQPIVISVHDITQVTFDGPTVSVSPSVELAPGATGQLYRVEIDFGVITDVGGNAFGGLYRAMYQFSIEDTSVPTLVSQTPENGSINVSATAAIVLSFNENVRVSTVGNITFTPLSNPGNAVVVTPSTGGSITAAGRNVTIVVGGDGLPPNQTVEMYTVAVSAGLILDSNGNNFDGFANEYSFSLADSVAPILVSTVPSNGSVLLASLTLQFSEPLVLGRGTLQFISQCETPSRNISTFDATQVSLSPSRTSIHISLASVLPSGLRGCVYTVLTGGTIVTDRNGNEFAGLHPGSMTFRVEDTSPPQIVNTTTVLTSTTSLSIAFSEAIVTVNGSVSFVAQLSPCPQIDIDVGDIAQVNVSGSSVSILPTGGWCGSHIGTDYDVVIPRGVFADSASNVLELSTFTFTLLDTVGPRVIGIVTDNIVRTTSFDVRFSEEVVRGAGSITVSAESQASSEIRVDVQDPRVVLDGNDVRIDAGGDPPLLPFTGQRQEAYSVTFPEGVFLDASANNNSVGQIRVIVNNTFVNTSVAPQVLFRGSNTTVFVSFVTLLGVRDFDFIVVTFPSTFYIPVEDLRSRVTVLAPALEPDFIRRVGHQVIIQKNGGLAVLPGQAVSMEIRGIGLPSTPGVTENYTIHIANSQGIVLDSVSVAGSVISASAAPIFEHSAAVVSASTTSGTVTQLNFSFTTEFDIQDFDSIFVVFPQGTPGDDGFSYRTGLLNDDFTALEPNIPFLVYADLVSRTLVAQKLSGTGLIVAGSNISFVVRNIRLPTRLGTTNLFNFYIRRLDGAIVDSFATRTGLTITESLPPSFSQLVYNVSFAETATGSSFSPALVATVLATHNSGVSINSYTIVGGNDDNLFTITPSGQIFTQNFIEFDGVSTPFYNLTIQAVFPGPPSTAENATVLINITNINDNRPVFVFSDPLKSFYDVTIHENLAVGTPVVVIAATDSDSGTNGALTLSFNGGDVGHFALNPATGAISVATSLSRSQQSYYNIIVRATDGALPPEVPLFAEAVVSVTILSDDVVVSSTVTVSSVTAFNGSEYERAVSEAMCPAGECTLKVHRAVRVVARRRNVQLQIDSFAIDNLATNGNSNASLPRELILYSATQIVQLMQSTAVRSRLAAANFGFTVHNTTISVTSSATTTAPPDLASTQNSSANVPVVWIVVIIVAFVLILLIGLTAYQTKAQRRYRPSSRADDWGVWAGPAPGTFTGPPPLGSTPVYDNEDGHDAYYGLKPPSIPVRTLNSADYLTLGTEQAFGSDDGRFLRPQVPIYLDAVPAPDALQVLHAQDQDYLNRHYFNPLSDQFGGQSLPQEDGAYDGAQWGQPLRGEPIVGNGRGLSYADSHHPGWAKLYE